MRRPGLTRSRGRGARATAALVGGRDEPLRYTTTAAQRASDYMPADLLSDSLLYILVVSYMRRLLVEQQALEHVPCADCEQYTGHPRGVSRLGPRRPAAVRRGRPRRSRSRRRICVADEVSCAAVTRLIMSLNYHLRDSLQRLANIASVLLLLAQASRTAINHWGSRPRPLELAGFSAFGTIEPRAS